MTKDWTRRSTNLALLAGLLTPAVARTAALSDGKRDAVKRDIEGYAARFVKSAQSASGLAFDRRPLVMIETTPQLSFSGAAGITLPLWEDLAAPIRQIFDRIAGQSRVMSAQKLFEDIFNWFIVAHELTHWYEGAVLGWRAISLDHYESELRCNRVAIAFWLSQGEGPRLEKLMAVVRDAAAGLPSPVPAGADARAFFDANYRALGANPFAYGWYQFHLFLDAWQTRGEKDFSSLIREMRGSRPEVLKPVDDFFYAFNRNDWATAAMCYAAQHSIIDDADPHYWSGPNAFQTWLRDNQALWAQIGLTGIRIELSDPSRVTVRGDDGYAVMAAKEIFFQAGTRIVQPGTFTFALCREAQHWRIAGWTWTSEA